MTVRRFETSNKPVPGKTESLIRIQSALEAAGIIFQPADGQFGVGVRFATPGGEARLHLTKSPFPFMAAIRDDSSIAADLASGTVTTLILVAKQSWSLYYSNN